MRGAGSEHGESRAEGARTRKLAADLYGKAARPALHLAEAFAADWKPDAGRMLAEAEAALARFGEAAQRAGAVLSTIAPARYGLALLLDKAARSNPKADTRIWSAGARGRIFDGRDLSVTDLREFIARAAAAGPDFQPVKLFLEDCLAGLEGDRQHFDRSTGASWTGIVIVLVIAFALAVAGWSGFTEWRFHAKLTRVFAVEAAQIGLDGDGAFSDLALRLGQLDAAVGRVGDQAAKAPIRLFAQPFGFDAAVKARTVYDDALARQLPPVLARALDEAIATDGDSVALYDDLRAWAILSGKADWSAAYLAGWTADRAAAFPLLAGLADHVARLTGPDVAALAPDGELLAQAQQFAAEADEPSRAYLELRRSDAAAALPGWRADSAIPGIADIIVRRSGLPLTIPIDGLFTEAGWRLARDSQAGVAVQSARRHATEMFGTPLHQENDAPDKIMVLLQRETLARWRDYLDDLRVRPFSDAETAILISGQLSGAQSPLEALLRAVWKEIGGEDRQRPHPLQLSIATAFGPMIQYVEQGRMRDISSLFASLNVALGAMDRDEETGMQRLMSIQDRAASIATLRQAPVVVVQIVEDVLAQTSAAHADLLTNPLTRAWQAEVLPLCKQAVEGRYPFAEGGDADLTAVAALFSPDGALPRYLRTRAAAYLDMSVSPWRWKPEARFAGLSPETAALFQHGQEISAALYSDGGPLDTTLSLSALAERGKAFIRIGGAGGPVDTATDSLRVVWPGADAAQGAEVSFQSPEGEARMAEGGAWGLLRLLDPVRLRERDEGRRFLVDLRSGGARLFLEIAVDRPQNILSKRKVLRGFSCPPVL
jgi:type VI protein secretion system component VasK